MDIKHDISIYVESFVIPGIGFLAIEDQQREGTPSEKRPYKIGKKQYACWFEGSVIGSEDSIYEARRTLHSFICKRIREKQRLLKTQLDDLDKSHNRLEGDVFHLGKFLIEKDL